MMTSHGRRFRAAALITISALILLTGAGCSPNSGLRFNLNSGSPFNLDDGSHITLVSYKDPYFPESIDVKFSECTCQVDASGDLQIVARGEEAAPHEAGLLERILYLHVYWQPRPGVTFSDGSSTTATIRYVLATRDGTASYTGTGFAYPAKSRSGDGFEITIETANVQLDTSTGQAPQALGVARLSGQLIARRDAYRTVDLMQRSALIAAGQPLP